MKKKTFAVISFIVPLLSTAIGAIAVDLAEANWLVPINRLPPSNPEITILLPELNEIYSSNIGLDFLVTGSNWGNYRDWGNSGSTINLSSFSYSLDDKPRVTLDGERVVLSDPSSLVFRLRFFGNLSGLSDGGHKLVVYAHIEGKYSPEPYQSANFSLVGASPKMYFTVDKDIQDTVLPQIAILSPTNRVYNKSDIALDFTLSETCSKIKYSLDGQNKVMINGNTTLTGLPDGVHNVAVYARDKAGNTKSSLTCFSVAAPPTILVTSPESQYYGVSNVTLSFIVNDATSWMGYSLDGENNQTITGNITLTDLTYGSHSIVLYAKDTNGYIGVSEIVIFRIDAAPFPTVLVTVASSATVAVGAGLLVYFKKRKHKA